MLVVVWFNIFFIASGNKYIKEEKTDLTLKVEANLMNVLTTHSTIKPWIAESYFHLDQHMLDDFFFFKRHQVPL